MLLLPRVYLCEMYRLSDARTHNQPARIDVDGTGDRRHAHQDRGEIPDGNLFVQKLAEYRRDLCRGEPRQRRANQMRKLGPQLAQGVLRARDGLEL